MVQNMVQKLVQKMVQSLFHPMSERAVTIKILQQAKGGLHRLCGLHALQSSFKHDHFDNQPLSHRKGNSLKYILIRA